MHFHALLVLKLELKCVRKFKNSQDVKLNGRKSYWDNSTTFENQGFIEILYRLRNI